MYGNAFDEHGDKIQVPLGFPTTSFSPGEGKIVWSSPQMNFQPKRLYVATDNANDFAIVDILVDGVSVMGKHRPLMALHFSVGSGMSFPQLLEKKQEDVPIAPNASRIVLKVLRLSVTGLIGFKDADEIRKLVEKTL